MNIVDSSGWLAYFADEPNAKHFLPPLKDTASLVVPTVTIYEVFKVVLRESGENDALQAAAAMRKGKVVDLTASLALTASRLSLAHHLPMADSIILATAEEFSATIWTQDSDFKDMANVRYFPKALLAK
jgi:predicted nucleic acid-binding protein